MVIVYMALSLVYNRYLLVEIDWAKPYHIISQGGHALTKIKFLVFSLSCVVLSFTVPAHTLFCSVIEL